ncbi:DUF4321 domain-containing protein [Tepidibacillus infernus]|uniref:DUF4321 domain-containing protein n=1 Tax=Tepidibacillus decaturensis TaxID=1413211 RepID=A0A135L210_9BACI|nr:MULTISPECIES: DUF4321 domain-containing protein [Tepidibacillus]KXG43054.1 hypothetical protein U473_02710 [Tepidibacillus decaturensis]GBF09991.1 hypothetical protein HK1_00003 [Tepidibacillus sp. HK-1]
MKAPQTLIFVIILISGLLLGSLIGQILGEWLPILKESQQIVWHPRADLNILKYDFNVQVKLNLASFIGLGLAFWLYRKYR